MSPIVEEKRGYTLTRTKKSGSGIPKGKKSDRIGRKGGRTKKKAAALDSRQTQFSKAGYYNCSRCPYKRLCKVQDAKRCPLRKRLPPEAAASIASSPAVSSDLPPAPPSGGG